MREVEEETGVLARLGAPLMELEYEFAKDRLKNVAYWSATPVSGDADAYVPNKEIDGVAWVTLDKAPKRLSYDTDRAVLEAFGERVASDAHRTRTLVVVRHAQARSRSRWRKEPLVRPLTAAGRREAGRLRPLLSAYGVHHLGERAVADQGVVQLGGGQVPALECLVLARHGGEIAVLILDREVGDEAIRRLADLTEVGRTRYEPDPWCASGRTGRSA